MSVATKVAQQQTVQLHIASLAACKSRRANRDGELEVTPSFAEATEGKPSVDKPKERQAYPVKKLGGTYFYSSAIMGNKNVFVTPEYMDLLVNAFRMAELKNDVKNIAYVVMPNHFMWIFKLSDKEDDPRPVYSDLKKRVTGDMIQMLRDEAKVPDRQLPLLDIFQDNENVSRSSPRKILWSFKEFAKSLKPREGQPPKRYSVWDKNARLYLLDNEHRVKYNLKFLADAPKRDRWRLVTSALEYPYLFVDDDYIPQLAD